MAERSQNLQDLFLNTVRKQKISLTIFLINGVKLTGRRHILRQFLRASASRRTFAARLQACDLDDHAGPAGADVRKRRSRVLSASHLAVALRMHKSGQACMAVKSRTPIIRALSTGNAISTRHKTILIPERKAPRRHARGCARARAEAAARAGRTARGHCRARQRGRARRGHRPCRAPSISTIAEGLIVPVNEPRPATLFGTGKIEEIKRHCWTSTNAGLVIVDHPLTPVQQRNLEKELERQGHRPHRPDPRNLRPARLHQGRHAAGRARPSQLSEGPAGSQLDPP